MLNNAVSRAFVLLASFFILSIQTQLAAAEDAAALSKSSNGETTFWVELTPEPEGGRFYTFWPGGYESPMINIDLPEGAMAGRTLYPVIEKRAIGGTDVYGFAPGTVILQEVLFDGEQPPESFEISFSYAYSACAEVCEEAVKGGTLSGVRGRVPLLDTAKFTGSPDTLEGNRLIIHANAGTNNNLTLAINFFMPDIMADIERVYFLPTTPGLLAEGPVMELYRSNSSFYDESFFGFLGTAPLATDGAGLKQIEGLAVFEMRGGQPIQSPALSAGNDYKYVLELGEAAMEPAAQPVEDGDLTLLTALLFALLGGVILNIMPCVLPVLALKVFSFMKAGANSAGVLRRDGLAYTGGILVSFAALGGILMALRASLGAFAWGFQLQQPTFVFAIIVLLFVVGLSFLGLFELRAGKLAGAGQKLTEKQGSGGAFATGVLAAIVATPCTAPFMAAALAFALAQPPAAGMLIFVALGLGLALPYLLLSFAPRLGRFLPKPGPWMTTFKEFLAFPIFATVIWLLWTLNIQSGTTGLLAALSALLLIAFAVWLGRTLKTPVMKKAAVAVLVLAALVPLAKPGEFLPAGIGQEKLTASKIELIPYSEAKLEKLRQEGTPVFLHFWAAWCPICILHEEYVFQTDEFQDYMATNGIQFMYVDNTKGSPEIRALMESFGRSGQPLDVFFPAGKEPVVLPEFYNTTYLLGRLDEVSAGE